MDVELSLRFSFGRGELVEADDRLFTLLRAVDEYGSLRRASEAAGLSYRAAWGLLREWTEHLGVAPVDMHRGRGAVLSELGRKLLWANQSATERLAPELDRLAHELNDVLESTLPAPGETRLTVHASHSMAQEILRELAVSRAGLQLDFHNHGSLDSLRGLKEGACQMAGFHLVEGPLRRRLEHHFRPWLHEEEHRLIRVASRRQGMMMRREVVDRIHGVADLAGGDIRFVNRQPGSGTRMLLDMLLEDAAVDPAGIAGYDHEEFTHNAVGALLSSGAADTGFGVEAAAVRFGLAFLPLATETYYFAAHEQTLERVPAAQHLVSVIASSEFRRRVAELSGYDPRHSGRRESVSELFSP
ncbi:MAG: substrate-binding domain-containing protein [Gammaproteobacteria bacterium]|nr:substrate-binding domain-containing protein [Gammaproteobacteria bacterium]